MSSNIHPTPYDVCSLSESSVDTHKTNSLATPYNNYGSLIRYKTYLRVLEDTFAVESRSAPEQEIRNGYPALSGLKKDEIVEVIERWCGDYWLGACKGRRGFVLLDHRVSFVLTSKARAIWDRKPDKDREMRLAADREVHLLFPYNHVWVWAMDESGADVGLVPFSFVECIPPEAQSLINPSISTPTPERPYGGHEWIPSENLSAERRKVLALWAFSDDESRFLRLEENDIIEVTAQPSEAWWIGIIFPKIMGTNEAGGMEHVGLFPSNYVQISLTTRTLVKPPWAPYYVRAIYSLKADESFELGLTEGEIIEVEHMCSDKWWKGRNRAGKNGWFPENYVSPVLSRFHSLLGRAVA